MTTPRFLQIHTLTSYTAALLNRDDTGRAKRLPYGGVMRTRISSQCLKRHWRITDDVNGIEKIPGIETSLRSRELVTERVIRPLRGRFPEEVVTAIEPELQRALYGEKGTTKKSRQTLLLGSRELEWLAGEAARLAAEAQGDAKTAAQLAEDWRKAQQGNLKAMRDAASIPGGIAGALFGRMVTSDPAANITAPVHVAHAFTVHAEESEGDYFTAVDDLAGDEPGADTIQTTELSSGIYYGYVVVDIPGLVKNLGGKGREDLAGEVLARLIHLIAEVSPGAKLGSTAPYGRASLLLAEAGDRQPRSLAEAFMDPCERSPRAAAEALARHLAALDQAYATGEERRALSILPVTIPGVQATEPLAAIAAWARGLPARLARAA